MYKDIFGKPRLKLGLHIHTNNSDGKEPPEVSAKIYKDAGYDAISFTEHWKHTPAGEVGGMPIIAGCEYDIGFVDCGAGVYHILALFCESAPNLQKGCTAQQIVDAIHDAGGLAVLAHPAWSLNTPEMIKALRGVDATEIYNAVSGVRSSRRADSSLIVDMLAMHGYFYPLLATDDCHYYGDDLCNAYIMVEGDSLEREALMKAIKEEKFYATQGPEIHLKREGDVFRVDCSPVKEIVFMSNACFSRRTFVGEDLTSAEYTPRYPYETYIRAYVTDKDGKHAWTNCIKIDN